MYEKILFAIVGITFLLIMLYNLTPYLYKNIKFFELKGDFNYSKLSFIDKLRVSYGSGKIPSNIVNYKEEIKNTNKSNLEPILEFLR